MPKILISEFDKTSPGTSDSYANYSVLVVGFAGDGDRETVKPDYNGVYEFAPYTHNKFEATIGLKGPEVENNPGLFHYGNHMAYELLKLGYTVIYKIIEDIEDIINEDDDENIWKVFRDKANYDFRFITHGLLRSSPLTKEQEDMKARLADVEAALAKLNEINEQAIKEVSNQEENYEQELADRRNELYQEVMDDFAGFLAFDKDTGEHSDEPYTSFALPENEALGAIYGVAAEKAYLEEALKNVIDENTINAANNIIANLAMFDAEAPETSGRGDCIALIELDEASYVNTASVKKPEELIIAAIERVNLTEAASRFCAVTVPSVTYTGVVNAEKFGYGKDAYPKFPGAFHYLACFMNSLKMGFKEWYAAAGYTRGVASYTVKETSVKLGEIAINALEPRNRNDETREPAFACNVIANFRGSYYLWGNRTAFKLYNKDHQKYGDLTASSFLNIRQLCTTLKKQLYVACRRFTFDPNSDTLWFNFVNAIKPTLEAMKADQGVRDYKIMKVPTEKKATLKARIRIIPIEAVEDFDLEVYLEDSFGETTAVVTD